MYALRQNHLFVLPVALHVKPPCKIETLLLTQLGPSSVACYEDVYLNLLSFMLCVYGYKGGFI